MSEFSPVVLIEQILRSTPRRYLLAEPLNGHGGASSRLAILIDAARLAQSAGREPGPELETGFASAMAELIQDALKPEGGDPVFQALVLRQRSAVVSEHAVLTEQARQDTRRLMRQVNALAHPGKLAALASGALKATLARLHTAAVAADWAGVQAMAQQLSALPEIQSDATRHEAVQQLRQEAALSRLRRLDTLQTHAEVKHYQQLREQQGPQADSHEASIQGAASRRRGAEVETLAKQALECLAARLNDRADAVSSGHAEGTHAINPGATLPRPAAPWPRFRVVSSLRVPGTLAAGYEGAKTEWDVVLLREAGSDSPGTAQPVWDIQLLVEAKASADASATDLPRLLRGLQLLAQADATRHYAFAAREGVVPLRGASLHALPVTLEALPGKVLYCSDGPAEQPPRLLSAASRMLLLSARESLAYALALLEGRADNGPLLALWHHLLHQPQWLPVLEQTQTLRQARALMVHTGDLMQAALKLDL